MMFNRIILLITFVMYHVQQSNSVDHVCDVLLKFSLRLIIISKIVQAIYVS
jgi:hypothetical protein